MDLEYSVEETIVRNGGHVTQIDYEFEETTITETPMAESTTGIKRQNREKRNRTYNATITRDQYQKITRQTPDALPFDAFVDVLRPFIMGYYANDELTRAFQTLDRDGSGTIHLDELYSFLPILNDKITGDGLNDYVRKVDSDFNGTMNYDEFRSLVLRGIGRDIICSHI